MGSSQGPVACLGEDDCSSVWEQCPVVTSKIGSKINMDNWRYTTNISETSCWEIRALKRSSSDAEAQGQGQFPSGHWFTLESTMLTWQGTQATTKCTHPVDIYSRNPQAVLSPLVALAGENRGREARKLPTGATHLSALGWGCMHWPADQPRSELKFQVHYQLVVWP